MLRFRSVILGAALLAPLSVVRAQSSDGVPFPGGVADGTSAFVDAASGGVEAIALTTGAVRWHAANLARPLAVGRERLAALAPTGARNELRVAVVDAASGKTVRMCETFALPAWVSIAPSYAHTFDASARVERDQVVVWWHATASWSQGMHPDEEQEAAARHEASGAVACALDSGRARAAMLAAPPPLVPAVPPAVAERHQGAARIATLDGRHLLIKRDATWIAVQLPSGKRVGELPLTPPIVAPVVLGARLYLERAQPRRRVQALQLAGGAMAWEHALATPPSLPPRP